MKLKPQKTALLGDLVVAAFDNAARHCTDQRKVSRLATIVVRRMLHRLRRDAEYIPEPDGYRVD